MRSIIIVAALASMAAGSSLAATQPAAPPPPSVNAAPPDDPGRQALPRIDLTPVKPSEATNPAVKTTEGNNPGAPRPGANSFTEGQAKSRIETRGFTNVSPLTKDDKGIWRGTAMQNGKNVQVSLDFQGNVVAN